MGAKRQRKFGMALNWFRSEPTRMQRIELSRGLGQCAELASLEPKNLQRPEVTKGLGQCAQLVPREI